MTIRIVKALAILVAFSSLVRAKAAEIDVTLSMPQDVTASPGATVTIPINLGGISGSFSLDAFQLIVQYDGSFFDTPLASGIKLGSLTAGKSYSGLDNVDGVSQSFTILRSNFSDPVTLTPDSFGSLMTFEIKVKESASLGSSGYLRFLPSQGAATTEILTLSGDNIVFSPAITAPAIQGLVTVPVPEPSTYVLAAISTVVAAAIARKRSADRKSNES